MSLLEKLFKNNNCNCHKSRRYDKIYASYDPKKDKIRYRSGNSNNKRTVTLTNHQEVIDYERREEWKDIGSNDVKIKTIYLIIECKHCNNTREEKLYEEETNEYRKE